jgi:hypothetical protein
MLCDMSLSRAIFASLILCALVASACSKDNSTPPAPTCTVTAGTPSTTSFGPEGGTGTISVTAGSGCAWTATSNASFLTISQGSSGSGNGTVQFSVAVNTGAERTGSILIAGITVAILQRLAAAIPPSPVTFGVPTPTSPIGGVTIDTPRPSLIVTNAPVTGGNAGSVTYRFEVSDQSSFPADPVRTFSVDGVVQGSGSTTGVIPRDLGPAVLWYWHARATNGTSTGAYSGTETFRTAGGCTIALSTTSFNAAPAGDAGQVGVTTTSTCAWTATSNASFITVTSGSSGTGNGTVGFSVASNGTGASRSGTIAIGGQTFTVNQSATGLSVGFRMIDNGIGPGAVTECQIRSTATAPSTCTLESTSFPLGTAGITDYSWNVQYVLPFSKTLTQSGTASTFAFQETCGQNPHSQTGELVDLSVTLTVTSSTGEVVTVRSGSGGQPALKLRVFTCGF